MSPTRALPFLCVLGVLTGLLACRDVESDEQAAPEIIRSVLTAEVRTPGQALSRSFSGLAQARDQTDLSFRISGELVALHVKTGDLVEADTLIAELDPTEHQIELQETQASLAQMRAEARNAEATYQRTRSLYEREGASKEELDAARTNAESTGASVSATQQQLRLAGQRLSYTKLRAPSSGAISNVPVTLRENVNTGEPVAVLQTGGAPEVEVAIPELLIGEIQEHDIVQVGFDAFPGETFEGKVRKVGIAPQDGGSTFPVTIELEADWGRIRPGMATKVSFRFAASNESAVVVPPAAVGKDADGHFVFLIEAEPEGFGITRRVAVTVGDVAESGLTVLSGLRGGETIVTAGVPRIKDETRVRVLSAGDWP